MFVVAFAERHELRVITYDEDEDNELSTAC